MLVKALKAVGDKYHVILDKYVKENGETEYYFKMQFDDIMVNIEEVFPVVYHGPPRKSAN